MTGGDAALMRYLQKAIGYMLTGGQQEKKMFVVVGEPDSGKTTLFETVAGIALDYATTANVESFLEDPRGMRTSTNDLAELCGYRLVITTEPDRNAKLSASRIKRNVGNDRTTTRLNYKQGKVGIVSYKIVMHCNAIPAHDQREQAVRNRLDILPGGKSVPPSEQDKNLPEKLRDEWPSILRWIIDGAVMWYAEGLGDKPAVAADVADDYNRAQDPMLAWHDKRVEQVAGAFTPTAALYEDYQKFISGRHGGGIGLDEFSKRLSSQVWIVRDAAGKSREYRYEAAKKRVEVGGPQLRGFIGLRLRPISSQPADEDEL